MAVGDFECIEGFDRSRPPGTVRVQLSEAGGYSTYHEFPAAGATGERLGDPAGDPISGR